MNELVPMSQCSYLGAILELKLAGHLDDINTLEFTKDSEFASRILPETLSKFEVNLVFNDC